MRWIFLVFIFVVIVGCSSSVTEEVDNEELEEPEQEETPEPRRGTGASVEFRDGFIEYDVSVNLATPCHELVVEETTEGGVHTVVLRGVIPEPEMDEETGEIEDFPSCPQEQVHTSIEESISASGINRFVITFNGRRLADVPVN